MAIVITQARFAAKGPQGVAAKPQDGLDAAGRLVAWIGGTLIASYRTHVMLVKSGTDTRSPFHSMMNWVLDSFVN